MVAQQMVSEQLQQFQVRSNVKILDSVRALCWACIIQQQSECTPTCACIRHQLY